MHCSADNTFFCKLSTKVPDPHPSQLQRKKRVEVRCKSLDVVLSGRPCKAGPIFSKHVEVTAEGSMMGASQN
jgi:hypothetical protein